MMMTGYGQQVFHSRQESSARFDKENTEQKKAHSLPEE
jgi:hypothetical protein